MTATLTKLKGIVQTYEGYNFEQISVAEKEELVSFVKDAAQTIMWEIEHEFDYDATDEIKAKYIADVQFQLTYLSSGVYGFNKDEDDSTSIPEILMWLLSEIYKLLEFLKAHFPAYFDSNQKLPPHYLSWYKESHPGKYSALDDLLENSVKDANLNILINAVKTANEYSEPFAILNWAQFDYFSLIVNSIEKLLYSPPSDNISLEILKLFINLDFNSIHVYGYFVKYIEQFTLGEDSFQEQQQELLYLLKVFRQVRVDAKRAFNTEIQSLKTSVVESLEAEINYIEQREKLYMENFRATNPESHSKFYFNVAITLAELMFFFRIMLEVKVITTKFNSYLYEFISNHIRTAKAENISKKSMRNHFNNRPFPDRNVQNVKSWLVKLLAHIDLYYTT